MSTTCPEIRAQLADHLDGLLTGEASAAVDAHVLGCASCAEALERVRASHGALYHPYSTPLPADDLRERILRRATRSQPSTPAGFVTRAWRYAASFAAGVLVTLALMSSRPTVPSPEPAPERAEIPAASPESQPPLRRIR